jgi:glucose/arabinose dehydrogenase/disulfide oxidoreductase YuzD
MGENRLLRLFLGRTRLPLGIPTFTVGTLILIAAAFAFGVWATGSNRSNARGTTRPTPRPSELRRPNRLSINNAALYHVGPVVQAAQEIVPTVNFVQQQKLIQAIGDGAVDDQFGISVAISGDTAIVGAYNANFASNNDQGSTYIYVRSGSTWSLQQKLTASDGAAGDGFGVSVAINGNTAIVGAYADDAGTEPVDADRGAAYVFVRTGGIWTEQQKLLPTDGAGGDLFGFSVSVNSDTALIGAPYHDGGLPHSGAAYVFTRSGLTWTQQQRLTASDIGEDDSFGVAVAVEGNTAAVGALHHDHNGNSNQGAAYIATRSGSIWTTQQELIATDATANDQFGVAVGLSGNSVIVGANFKDNGSSLGQGAAYVFTGSGASWTQQQKLLSSDGAGSDAFGTSVSISGDEAVVGSSDNDGGASDQGSAYTFARTAGTWNQEQNLTAVDGAASDFFGSYVAIDGASIIAGAPQANIAANGDQGGAYIFEAGSALSINDVQITEGNSGTSLATFTVTLASASAQTVMVQYATQDGTATAGSDYVAASGTLTFTPGQLTQPISITINGDTTTEPNETFFVNLTSPSNALVSDGQGMGTIQLSDPSAVLPSGFVETQFPGLNAPTAMALAPDDRIFVCEQAGTLRVIKNGALLSTPFVTLTVNSSGERGLLGVAFDPNFATNNFIYLYYTATTPAIHNRVSRFTANGDVVVPGSEVIVLDLNNLSGATNHNGGAIHFGPDGKLYIAVGENANPANAQSFSNLLGKILRINPDPADLIPTDNPYFNDPGVTGNNKAIWALGLRNPFTFGFQPGTGRMFINDVGQNAWEEINEGVAHSNYGWSICEGDSCSGTPPTDYRPPLYVYNHTTGTPTGCAIVGGAFYNPTTLQFPAGLVGKYFFADLCTGFIRYVNPSAVPPFTSSSPFATGISSPVDLQVGNDGSFYYLSRGSNSVFRIQYTGGSTLAINDVSVVEGNSGTVNAGFNVTLSPASAQTVTVQYTTANDTATAGSDYTFTSGTLTFNPGQTSQPINVPVNGDTTSEPNETFFVNLSSPANATIDDGQGVGTITNDDQTIPTISINDVSIAEGNSGTTSANFTVTLSGTSAQSVTVQYATANNTATAGNDYTAASGTVTFMPGQTSQPVSITINGDITFEPNETFFVNLTSPTNGTISDSQGVGTISNDDPQPSITINDVSVTEGNSGTTNASFTVSLSNPSSQTITVNFGTANGTATAASDYTSASGTVTFTTGQTSQPVNITVTGDTTFEASETFTVNLTSPVNATIADTQGIGTITNDDLQPVISINDISVSEGNAGLQTATFTASLTNASSQTVTVNYATANGTATTAGNDYQAATGTITFAPGQTAQTVNVTIIGDTTFEPNETFVLNLSGAANATISDNQGQCTITNDDLQPSISISDVSLAEGNSGTTTAQFVVSLSNASSLAVTVNYATANGTATDGSDYTGSANTVSFVAGAITQVINVTVNGDQLNEPDETFFVNISGATNATISDSQGQGTILNDDSGVPVLEFTQANFSQNEANQSVLLTVKRTGNTAQAASVDFQTNSDLSFVECTVVNGQANQRCDYLLTTGTLSFAAGEIQKSFSVITFNDTLVEGNETFTLSLANPTGGAVLGTQSSTTVTIQDDDLTPPTTNPIDNSRYFVRQTYYDFLQRVPDQGGEDFWTGQIDGLCSPGDAQCINRRRVAVSAAFFVSSEFTRSGGFVYRLYKSAYGEQSLYRPSYSQFSPDRARVVDGADLEQGKLALANGFVQRPEFIARYPNGMTPADFVDAILQTVQQGSGVGFTPTERQNFINDVTTSGRGLMLKNLADNTAFTNAVFNRAFVLMQYFGYLRRDPDQGGYEFWLGILNASSQNFEGMVCAFITSAEYQRRFSSVVTRNDSICQ